jgi:hypothetical protein
MTGAALISSLKKKFRVSTDAAVAKHLGISLPAVQLWKGRKVVTPRQVASLVHKASFQSNIIRPIVEFFPIEKVETKRGASYETFSIYDDNDLEHPYRSGLKDELLGHHGVYVFFDSRGQVIYAGKARRQSLWKELNLAFNRDRGEVQSIYRVTHPINKVPYQRKPRQIVSQPVALHELAAYFSAYQVPDAMINDLESMLVRSFANDLLNIRMEKFKK